MGTWLVLSDQMLEDEERLTSSLLHCHDHVKVK